MRNRTLVYEILVGQRRVVTTSVVTVGYRNHLGTDLWNAFYDCLPSFNSQQSCAWLVMQIML